MVLRKVSEIDDTYDFPFSVIEQQDDGIIIEFDEYYPVQIQATDDDGTLLYETKDVIDDTGNIVGEEQIPIMTTKMIKVDVPGEPATWMDVTNPLYFDFKIGNNIYSWTSKPSTTKVGLTNDGSIGIVKYKKIRVNNTNSNIRKIISPKFTPLKLVNGKFTINGICRPKQSFVDAKTGQRRIMQDIFLIRDDIKKHLTYDIIEVDENGI